MRSGTEMGSTSSAKGRYRNEGIDEFFCWFQAGWSAGAGFAGAEMVREADTNASAEDMQVSPWM
ncbi:hypothetical protein GCM10011591_36560 [Nocardia camponoti]|uniref:Uncharacterized protein n=1 Tax=Nocardia camponoti TaxID=1616106 RepID=A0A917QNB8_9NOCA|nr:hypothetical protein GCM10011591_36560 [Nocardia camponoti]